MSGRGYVGSEQTCLHCGATFIARAGSQKYCHPACGRTERKGRSSHPVTKPGYVGSEQVCANPDCGRIFVARSGRHRYCHPACGLAERRRRGGSRIGSEEFRAIQRDLWIDQNGPIHWTEERIIGALLRYAAEHGHAPSSHEWNRGRRRHPARKAHNVRRSDRPSNDTVINVFGSWAAALEAAGLSRRSPWLLRKPFTHAAGATSSPPRTPSSARMATASAAAVCGSGGPGARTIPRGSGAWSRAAVRR